MSVNSDDDNTGTVIDTSADLFESAVADFSDFAEMSSSDNKSDSRVLMQQQLTAIQSIVTIADECHTSPPDSVGKARARSEYLSRLWEQCRLTDSRLRAETSAEQRDKIPYFMENTFFSVELRVLDCLEICQEVITSREAATAARSSAASYTSGTTERRVTQVPRINLPSFSGAYSEWPSFHDYFESLFIRDESFDDLQRLHYLKSCLTGEAAQLIRRLTIVASNFVVAWRILKTRYENKRHLTWSCLKSFFALPNVTQESATELRALVNHVNESIEELRNLKRSVDSWSDVLVYQTVSKLDANTRKAWEIHLGDSDEYPTFEQLNAFLTTRIRSLEAIAPTSTPTSAPTNTKSNNQSNKNRNVQAHHNDASSSNCPACQKKGHFVFKCKQFAKFPFDQRNELVKTSSLCFNCLSPKHNSRRCQSKTNCRHCGQRHHSLLHRVSDPATGRDTSSTNVPTSTATQPSNASTSNEVKPGYQVQAHVSAGMRAPNVILATAWVRISSPSQKTAKVRALLDQGSTHTLITDELSRALNLATYKVHATLSGVGGTSIGKATRVAPISVFPVHTNVPALSTDALVLPSLTAYTPQVQVPASHWPHLQGLSLADPEPQSDAKIHMIIGADIYAYALRDGLRKGVLGQPVAQQTIFGWVISGGTAPSADVSNSPIYAHLLDVRESLGDTMRRFWEVEEVPGTVLTKDDEICEAHFRETHSRSPDGRYVVRLPFRVSAPLPFGNSRQRADRLLLALERRMAKDPQLREHYVQYLRDYEKRGHMTLVPEKDQALHCVYLSHHPVVKMTSTTTKVRVVFNASAPTSTRKSLNDLQFAGPKLQTNLPLLITRWRSHRYVCCADIEQMYRQIWVHSDDCDYQRIRWRFAPEEPIQSYRLRTVTFGMASAPYLAQRVLSIS